MLAWLLNLGFAASEAEAPIVIVANEPKETFRVKPLRTEFRVKPLKTEFRVFKK